MLLRACLNRPFNGVYLQICSQAERMFFTKKKKDLECSSIAIEKENMEAGPRRHTDGTAREKADTRAREL